MPDRSLKLPPGGACGPRFTGLAGQGISFTPRGSAFRRRWALRCHEPGLQVLDAGSLGPAVVREGMGAASQASGPPAFDELGHAASELERPGEEGHRIAIGAIVLARIAPVNIVVAADDRLANDEVHVRLEGGKASATILARCSTFFLRLAVPSRPSAEPMLSRTGCRGAARKARMPGPLPRGRRSAGFPGDRARRKELAGPPGCATVASSRGLDGLAKVSRVPDRTGLSHDIRPKMRGQTWG